MIKQYFAVLFILFFSFSTVYAIVPMPARIGGTLTSDNIQITQETDTGYIITVTKADSTSLSPSAEDTDGLNSSGWYLIDIPVYDKESQPGGAVPEDTLLIHVYKDGTELKIISPADGEFIAGESSSATQINLSVISSSNLPPIAIAGTDQTVNQGDKVTLNGSNSSDPDTDDVITYKWRQIAGTSVTLSDNTSVQPYFTAPAVGVNDQALVFELTVTDSQGSSDTDQVTVNVRFVNKSPTPDAGDDQTVKSGDTVRLDGSGSSDSDNGIASYLWQQTSGISVTLSDKTSVNPTFTAPETGGSLIFELIVTDKSGMKSTDSVTVTVTPGNIAPKADAGKDQAVNEGVTVILNGTGSSDPDDGIASYSWKQTGGTSVNLSDNTAVQPTFISPNVGEQGENLIFELTVKDHEGLTDTESVTISIRSVNQSPVADAGSDQTVNEGEQVFLDGLKSSDADDGIASYLWIQTDGTPVKLSDAAAVKPSFTASEVGVNGESLVFKLTVTDKGGLSSSDTVTVNILNLNQAPIADAGFDQTVKKGDTVTLDGSESYDPDGIITAYLWRQISGTSVTLSDKTVSNPIFVAEYGGSEGEALGFELTVTDDLGAKAKDYVTVNITFENQPPTADAGDDQAAEKGNKITLDGSGSYDSDGEIIYYSWRQIAGTVMKLSDATTVKPYFTISDSKPAGEALIFELTVTDNGNLQNSDQVTVKVSPENRAPTANAGADQSVKEGDKVTLDGSASSDSDGEIVSYQWRQISGNLLALSDITTAKASFTAPDVGVSGATLIFELTVTDNEGLSDTARVTVNVVFVNQPPIADAGKDRAVIPGGQVTLDGTKSYDPDNGISAYSWKQIQGTVMILSGSDTVQPVFTANGTNISGESLTFELTVTDNSGLTGSDSVIITVTKTNQPPVADAGDDQTVKPGDKVALNGSESYDPDGAIVSYLWVQTAGTPMKLSDTASVKSEFYAENTDSSGESLIFELVVTDNSGLQNTDRLVINVRKENQAPLADAGPDQNVKPNEKVILDGSNSVDPDGEIISYLWRQIKGTEMTISDAEAVKPEFIALNGHIAGESLTFELTVTDNDGLQNTDRVTINVSLENQPPTADAGPDQTVKKGDKVTLDGSESYDSDGFIVSYLWIQISGTQITLSDATAAQTFFTIPEQQSSEAVSFELVVADDGGLQHTDRIIINISSENQPPAANAGADQTAAAGCIVTLDGSDSYDPEKESLSFLWRQISGAAVTLSDAKSAKPAFTSPDTGVNGNILIFELTVTDSSGLKSTDSVLITVTYKNNPPIADAGSVQTVISGENVMLDGSGSRETDSGDKIVSYMWSQIYGTTVSLSDPASVKPSFTAPYAGTSDIKLSFKLTVTDTGGLQDTDTVDVNVIAASQSPVADAGDDQNVSEGCTVILNASESEDSDGNIISYLWKQTGGTSVTLSDTTVIKPTFVTPPVTNNGAVLVFNLTVTDNSGLQDTDDVQISISDNGINIFPDDVISFHSVTDEEMGLKILNGNIISLSLINPATVYESLNRPQNFIYGMTDIEIKVNLPGATASIIFYLPESAPEGYKWYKYSTNCYGATTSSAKWCVLDENTTFNAERDQITITLTDGKSGDDDGITNGVISDFSGLGYIPSESDDDDDDDEKDPDTSGGCFITISSE